MVWKYKLGVICTKMLQIQRKICFKVNIFFYRSLKKGNVVHVTHDVGDTWRYARCWWHLTLRTMLVTLDVTHNKHWKERFASSFSFFFFLICVRCVPWVWLGWRWCGCVLMYCSLFRNFTFWFYWFWFYFGLLVYICVVDVFL